MDPNILKHRFIWIVATIAILAGIFLRFYNLDKRIFWYDETISASHISGSPDGWYTLLKEGTPIEARDLLAFQAPNKDLSLKDTIYSLAYLELSHAPLFFVLLYYWAKFVGCSVAQLRLLPAFISLFQIPAIFWLCFELSGTVYLGALAAPLLALSPVLVLYAKETREYSLLTLAVLLVNASFLRAVNRLDRASWITYSLIVIFALYTSPLTFLVLSGQLVYLFWGKGYRWKGFSCFLAACLIALVAFIPWLKIVWEHFGDATSSVHWLFSEVPLLQLARNWYTNFTSALFDPGDYRLGFQLLLGLTVLFELYCTIETFRKSPQIGKFLLSLIGTTTIPLLLCDLIFHWQCSLPVRYQLAATIGTLVTVAYLFYIKLHNNTPSPEQQAWKLAYCLLLCAELVCCVICSQAETWREMELSASCAKIALSLNQEVEPPILATDEVWHQNPRHMLVISHLVRPTTKILLLNNSGAPKLEANTTHFYAYNIAPAIRQNLEKTKLFKFSDVQGVSGFARVDRIKASDN